MTSHKVTQMIQHLAAYEWCGHPQLSSSNLFTPGNAIQELCSAFCEQKWSLEESGAGFQPAVLTIAMPQKIWVGETAAGGSELHGSPKNYCPITGLLLGTGGLLSKYWELGKCLSTGLFGFSRQGSIPWYFWGPCGFSASVGGFGGAVFMHLLKQILLLAPSDRKAPFSFAFNVKCRCCLTPGQDETWGNFLLLSTSSEIAFPSMKPYNEPCLMSPNVN